MQIGGIYTIDFAKVSKIPKFTVNVKKGDNKRTIKLILLKNNEVLNLNNYTVVVAAKKIDGKDIFNAVKIVNAKEGICEVEITEQMLALNIDLPCEIVLYGPDGSVAASSNFVINKINNLRDEKSIISSSEFTALTEALTDILDVKLNLNKKANKDEVFSMANMGQDIKEAMTGGSVAVVAVNGVFNTNIVNHTITKDKITNNLTIPVTSLEIVHRDNHVNYNNEIIALPGCNVYKFKFNENMQGVSLNFGTNYIFGNIYDKNDNKIKQINQINGDYNIMLTDGYILINSSGDDRGIISINVTYNTSDILTVDKIKGVGYIFDNNAVETAHEYRMYEFKRELGYKYFKNDANPLTGCCYDNENNFLGNIILGENNELLLDDKCTKFVVNVKFKNDIFKSKKEYTYKTIVNKPFNFNGEADFFGDSITKGCINFEDTTVNNWVNIFKEKAGFSKIYNKGVGGLCLTSTAREDVNLVENIKATKIGSKFIFIAIGTNDYGLNAKIGKPNSNNAKEIYGAMNILGAHLKETYPDREIIFILPINRVLKPNNESLLIDDYRQAIFEKCIEFGYSVVNGEDFGFPNKVCNNSTILFGDNLHPTEAGYKLYANALATVLL